MEQPDVIAATGQDNTAPAQQPQQPQSPAPAPEEAQTSAPSPEAARPLVHKTNLLSEPPAEAEAEAGAEAGAENAAESGEGADFELRLPEGFVADEEAVGELKRMMKDGALTKEAAQGLADQHMKAIERYEAWRFQKGNEQVQAWEDEVRNHPEYGGARLDKTVETCRNMLHRYASPKMVKEFNDSGMLAHPEFAYMLMNISRDVSEGVSIGGAGQATPEMSAAKVLFPDFK